MTGQPAGPRSWAPQPADDVPDGLILFDGVCVLCSRSVRWVIARDPEARWRFVPIQSPYGRELAGRFGLDPENPDSVVAFSRGLAHFKADAALAVLRTWPAWRWTALAYGLPRPLRAWLYDRVARNRYRVFGRTDSCMVPSPALAGRFVHERPGR